MTIEEDGFLCQHGVLPQATIAHIVWFTIGTRNKVCKYFEIKKNSNSILQNSSTVVKGRNFSMVTTTFWH